MKKFLPLLIIFLSVLIFFWQFLLKGLLPIPSDTIVGLYYPFREIYQSTNPNGVPYKNFLVTDPVRQQYPWKKLVIDAEKYLNLPIWNPYSFSGSPLLANFQSAVFYPFNILFFILPFYFSWSLLIFLQPLLSAVFLYLYLDNLKLRKEASFLGAIAFAFSGFSIAWLEWGTIGNTALWLPLILLSIDKILEQFKISNFKRVKSFGWPVVFTLSLVFSFFAGHLQTFFYLSLISIAYLVIRWFQEGRSLKSLGLFVISSLFFVLLTIVQWMPTLQFILLSARNVDLPGYTQAGWFIPWQNLIQFLAPDFFGNPATLNYFGIWNYAEFIGYIGIFPLIIAFFAMFFRRDKKTLFFGIIFFVSLFFAFPTIFAKIPFKLDIPFLSTAQPTRLLFLIDFSLAVLSALGLDYFISLKNKKTILYVLIPFALLFAGLWLFVLAFHGHLITASDLRVAKQNLIFPTIIFAIIAIILVLSIFLKGKLREYSYVTFLIYALIVVSVFDLFRFGWKFEPFTTKQYIFPSTAVINFLQSQNGSEPFRVMSTDSKIFPPNFSSVYKIQTLDGYDPLYLQRYGELMAAVGRDKPDISTPFGFNRIITPQNYSSRILGFLNAVYVLSLEKKKDNNLNLVFTDGTIYVYANKQAIPRAFFVTNTKIVNSKQEAINAMFEVNYPLSGRAIVENVSAKDKEKFLSNWSQGELVFSEYGENKIIIKTQTMGQAFMVLTDSFYPTWHAKIDGKETNIYLTDYNFRGIIVPKGEHTIEFYDTLF